MNAPWDGLPLKLTEAAGSRHEDCATAGQQETILLLTWLDSVLVSGNVDHSRPHASISILEVSLQPSIAYSKANEANEQGNREVRDPTIQLSKGFQLAAMQGAP